MSSHGFEMSMKIILVTKKVVSKDRIFETKTVHTIIKSSLEVPYFLASTLHVEGNIPVPNQ